MAYLVDTDVIISSLKGEGRVHQWIVENHNIPKLISVTTYGELIYGAEKSLHPGKNIATQKELLSFSNNRSKSRYY
jgi:tRNA(fMet)-specific endonuclease VapC